MIKNSPVWEKCKGDPEPGVRAGATLIEVVLRYEVMENGQTFSRTVRIEDPSECEGVLWTEKAKKDVTRFRLFSRLRRMCLKAGSERPAWLRVLQSTQPVPATPGADEEGLKPGGQVRTLMYTGLTEKDSDEVELTVDSGNCYYYNGQIICC